jgi:peptidoglycan/LPS O-acetylase OafA/YrhL
MTEDKHTRSSKYRPDIDGLRAIAVLAVIAFHLHFVPMSGGYVGVDVFFVISGYLISGILLREMREGRFSIARFYERRCRRILPALFVVALATIVLGFVYLLPDEFKDYGKSLIATVSSLSNIYFCSKTSYFAGGGPLLHTWSLAVEEQFYLGFPILLFLIHRWRPRWLTASILVITGISLIISIVGNYEFPVANFYMPYTRAWELLLGAILSFRILPQLRVRLLREACSILGTLLILFSIFKYNEATPFPGLAALAPCIGAALVIFAGESGPSLVGSVLSLRPLTFLGAISYSLYLWHWPLLFFGGRGFLTFNDLSHRANVAIFLAICIGLSTLSWKFVELPARFGGRQMPRPRLLLAAGVCILAFAAAGLSILALGGLPARYPPAALAIAQDHGEEANTRFFRRGSCFIPYPAPFSQFAPGSCLQIDSNQKNYLLLGDSHAAALWHALDTQLTGVNVLQATASNCKPFPDQGTESTCGKLMAYVYDQYLTNHRVDAILITSRWKSRDLPEIASLVKLCKSKGIPLVVIGPAEEYDAPLPILLAYSIRANDPELPYRHRITQVEGLDHQMRQQAERTWHVPYLSLIRAVCTDQNCDEYADASKTTPMLFDHDHYTDQGAISVLKVLISKGEFAEIANPTYSRARGAL